MVLPAQSSVTFFPIPQAILPTDQKLQKTLETFFEAGRIYLLTERSTQIVPQPQTSKMKFATRAVVINAFWQRKKFSAAQALAGTNTWFHAFVKAASRSKVSTQIVTLARNLLAKNRGFGEKTDGGFCWQFIAASPFWRVVKFA
ncbi:MAG: hypothetical protein AAFQ22_07725 [Pseudomonadota bacterium]